MNKQHRTTTQGAKGLTLILLGFSVLFCSATQAVKVPIDRVVAIVNDDVILQSELNRKTARIRQGARESGESLPSDATLNQAILERLVIESIQMQMAIRGGIRIDDGSLNRAMASVAQQNSLSFEEFKTLLETQSAYLSTREQIRVEMLISQVQRGAVNSRISITDQEIENYLASEAGKANMAAIYHVSHMVIPIPEHAAPEVIDERAEVAQNLYRQSQDGSPFEQLIGSSFAVENHVTGTDLGWRKADGLPSLFTDIVPEMQAGDVHDPIRSANGFHIIKLLEVRGGTSLTVKQNHLRHILISPNEIRTSEQAHELITSLLSRIKDGEDFADIARKYSDDSGSVVAGGDLDWITEGSLPPQLETTVMNTPTGEISEPFATPMGWHLMQVLERRVQDVSGESMRGRAMNAIRSHKFDLELENWLIELREDAYVNIKI